MTDFDAVKINEKTLLNRLASKGQKTVADAISVDESTITNMKSGSVKVNFRSIATMLDVLDLKVVDKNKVCYHPDKIQPIIDMAREYMKTLDAKTLEWDE